MDQLVIHKSASKARKIARIIAGIYLVVFCGYFVFNEAAIDRYDLLFYAAVVGALLGLLLFLSNTLWASDKALLKVDASIIESNVPQSKFKANWVSVSKVSIATNHIIFYVDGGRKERKLDLADLIYRDVPAIKSKVAQLCEYKNIAYLSE